MMAQNLPLPPDIQAISGERPLALFLDFDGTLIDIAPTPDGITVPPDLAARLTSLAEQLEGRLALVSGRAIPDLQDHLGIVGIACAGSHGSDCRAADGTPIGDEPDALSDEVLHEVGAFAAANGFALEDKPHGTALHYRANPELEEQGLAFAHALALQHGLAVKRGKCVIELVAQGADKAGAVRNLMQFAPFAGAFPVFVGDDITDEDGMRAAVEMGGFGIAVGDRPSENAVYALANPAAVQQWLRL